jgi:hypothetical protein
VICDESIGSPAATRRTALAMSVGGESLTKNPLAHARRAGSTFSSVPNPTYGKGFFNAPVVRFPTGALGYQGKNSARVLLQFDKRPRPVD